MTDEPLMDEPLTEELSAPRPNRFGRVLVVLLALAVAVGVIVRIADSGSSSKDAAQPTSTTGAPPTVQPVPIPPVPVRPVPVPPFRRVPPCPRADDGLNACSTYPGLAPPTEQALRERFPQIVVDRAVTQMLRPSSPAVRPGLWSRTIRGRVGALRLRIAVRRAEPEDSGSTGLRQGNRLQMVRYFRGHFLVEFELRGPVDPRSLSRTIAWLLTEPRLVRPALAQGGTMMG